jgi:primosomal protein N' (replication factor Y)
VDSPVTNRARPQPWLIPLPGEAGHDVVADVAVAARTQNLPSYSVPPALLETLRPGSFVRVPLGRGRRVVDGLCVRVSERAWDHTRRPVLEARPAPAWLDERLIALGLWVSDYYWCPPWITFAALIPAPLRKPRPQRARRTKAAPAAGGEDVAVSAGVEEDEFTLTEGQRAALERLRTCQGAQRRFRVFLLFGVPGSGKTEVYVRAARTAIAEGRQAILLIPEIALTTQLVQRLARRFPRVAVLHSQLSPRIRRETLERVARGEADLIVGTRSAVFAPCPNPGLIIVDEEQEGSFKNLAAPFYHARDVAIRRGQLEDIPVLLGSATPALETWFNAQNLAHFELLRLPERVPGARLPEVRVVEMPPREFGDDPRILSRELARELADVVAARRQAVILHNRRGYATFLSCAKCGLAVHCPRCGTRMVFHQPDRTVRCHRCGSRDDAPTRCRDDSCGGELRRGGAAIQRLEEELSRRLPQARLLRLDRDTMRRRADYEQALDRFQRGEADILLGTQMVAKGLDFPAVRLVGVVDADAALALADFRAMERVFQLVFQVVGRAGRKDGRSLAIVQTSLAASPAIAGALRMDYEAFATGELAIRRRFLYPPLVRMVRLVCGDARPGRARGEAEKLATGLTRIAGRVNARIRVDEAHSCPVPRLREMLRYQVIVRAPRGVRVQDLLRAATEDGALRPRVQRFTIDVDPVDML